jgi:hypothetical protein
MNCKCSKHLDKSNAEDPEAQPPQANLKPSMMIILMMMMMLMLMIMMIPVQKEMWIC